MKSKIVFLLSSTAIASTLHANPQDFPEGITFGTGAELFMAPAQMWGNYPDLYLAAGYSGIWLESGVTDQSPGDFTGGVTLRGTPIRLLLGAQNSNSANGKFEILTGDALWSSGTSIPLFSVNSDTNKAKFDGVDVEITNGALKWQGNQVATLANLPSIFESVTGKIDMGNGFANTNGVAIGTLNPIAGVGAVALGQGNASGLNSFASGYLTSATGSGSVALGQNATAAGGLAAAVGSGSAMADQSFATGQSYVYPSGYGAAALAGGAASGQQSFAAGSGTQASNWGMASIGMFPIYHGGSANTWVATDTVFVVGNGTQWDMQSRSDAIVTTKNGKTKLMNKYWSPGSALADPVTNTSADADGVALQVDGHTILNGKVIITQPQGNISMGIYQ